MAKSFLTDAIQPPEVEIFSLFGEPISPREPVRLLSIGSRRGVTKIIHNLYSCGFAQVGEWSPLLPGRTPGEVMSILTRYIVED
jgi:hypothetical protein